MAPRNLDNILGPKFEGVTESYLGLCHISMMETFWKILDVN